MFANILIGKTITLTELKAITEQGYGFMVKAVVDLDKQIMVIGAELHVDEEGFLLDSGSEQASLWGINIFPDKPRGEWIQFDSMINVRPTQNNKSRSVENLDLQKQIKTIVDKLVLA